MSAPDTFWVALNPEGEALGVWLSEGDARGAIAAMRDRALAAHLSVVERPVVSPSVRLARWLDADPRRMADVSYRFSTNRADGWRCVLRSSREASPIIEIAESRDAALSAALDQAEGVQDGRG